jgi:hypothetical protein
LERKSTVGKHLVFDFMFWFFFYLRWVRFEEIAESVLGRWSKPHVATLMQTSLLDLKELLIHGVILLNIQPQDLPGLSRKFK